MSDEEDELHPPAADRVARRALILAAVVCRSGIESDAGNADAETFREEVIEWVEDLGLMDEIEPTEMALLRTPLGELSERQTIEASWKTEGLAVLGWALGRYELPPYDVPAEGPAVGRALGFNEDHENTVLSNPQLRPRAELTSLSDVLFSLHWRLRQYSLDGAAMDFAELAQRAWFGPLSLDGLRLCEGDLEIRGVPLFRAPKELWREAMSIALERQLAANWLEGQDPIYSQVTADT
jgi:hypothetical protein